MSNFSKVWEKGSRLDSGHNLFRIVSRFVNQEGPVPFPQYSVARPRPICSCLLTVSNEHIISTLNEWDFNILTFYMQAEVPEVFIGINDLPLLPFADGLRP